MSYDTLFKDRAVLISGGCGFIGSMLARRLVGHGARVTIIDSLIPSYGGNLANIADIRDRVWLNISDVRDPYAIEQLIRGQDYLFNLAGQTSHLDSMSDPFTDLNINATAQLSILEAARRVSPKIRIVFASTRQLYGKPKYLPVDEDHPVLPVDINGIHKLAGEYYHLLYHRVYGIPSSCLRLTNTYGPGMRVRDARQTFLGIWIKLLLSGQAIKVFGDGAQLRDFNYVDDVVDALLRAATRDEAVGQVMNLGSDEVICLKDLAALMVAVNGGGEWELVPFPPDRKAIDIGDYYGNWSRARAAAGLAPDGHVGGGAEALARVLSGEWLVLLGVVMSTIAMNDFRREPDELVRAELAACERVIRSGWWILGREVTAFEQAWATYLGTPAAVGCANGLDAIEFGLSALGHRARGRGDHDSDDGLRDRPRGVACGCSPRAGGHRPGHRNVVCRERKAVHRAAHQGGSSGASVRSSRTVGRAHGSATGARHSPVGGLRAGSRGHVGWPIRGQFRDFRRLELLPDQKSRSDRRWRRPDDLGAGSWRTKCGYCATTARRSGISIRYSG